MTPYALPCALVATQRRLRAFAVRSFCREILHALGERFPENSHVRYSDEHVTCVYWPRGYTTEHRSRATTWQPGMLMETHGLRFYNELDGRVLLVRDDVAAGLVDHLPKLREALLRTKGAPA